MWLHNKSFRQCTIFIYFIFQEMQWAFDRKMRLYQLLSSPFKFKCPKRFNFRVILTFVSSCKLYVPQTNTNWSYKLWCPLLVCERLKWKHKWQSLFDWSLFNPTSNPHETTTGLDRVKRHFFGSTELNFPYVDKFELSEIIKVSSKM